MRRTRITIHALIAATVVAGGMAALTPSALAITIPVLCSEQALVDAVNLANSVAGHDTLMLAAGCTYTVTSAHGSSVNGDAALPVITTPIEMIGPATITRDSTQGFRIAEVSPAGSLTLTTDVTLTNGHTTGDGGGILNFGEVTLTTSTLSGNTALGNGGGLANADTPADTAAATFTNSAVSDNTALGSGGGIYNGQNGTLTTSGVSGSPLFISGNMAGVNGGGIAAPASDSTTLTETAVTGNHADVTAGGVYREGGTMTTTVSPITANTDNNCVGSAPAVPDCTA